MPFDMTPSVETDEGMIYQRLLILRELLTKSGSQDTWCTCVWNEARTDERLRAMGVHYAPRGYGPASQDRALFGRLGLFVKRDSDGGVYKSIFGDESKEEKRRMLNNEIRRLRRRLRPSVKHGPPKEMVDSGKVRLGDAAIRKVERKKKPVT